VTSHPRKISVLVKSLLAWFRQNARDLPWRRTRDPYAVWVSEIMLQQTQVKTVIPFWNRWMRELPTIEAAAKAPSAKIHKLWEGLGYYTRVRNLQKAAQVIVAECRRRGDESQTGNKLATPHVVSYRFPEKFEDVLALPGIGRYTAGAICSIAFNQPTPILDGNVIRVLTRIFGIAENPKEKATNARLWKLAEELVCRAACLDSPRSSRREEAHFKSLSENSRNWNPELGSSVNPQAGSLRYRCSAGILPAGSGGILPPVHHFKTGSNNIQSLLTSAATFGNCSALNQSLMELGALVCTPRNPQCAICPVRKPCVAFKESRVEGLPNLGKRESATARRFIAFAVERDGNFLVRQRPAGVVNAQLWEFPNLEVTGAPSSRPSPPAGEKVAGGRLREKAPASESFDLAKAAFQKLFGVKAKAMQPLQTVKHSITRYRITLEAFAVSVQGAPKKIAGVWKTPAQMRTLAFSSAHKKILTKLPDAAKRSG
jgi:A/G-specific adenine glycosylase